VRPSGPAVERRPAGRQTERWHDDLHAGGERDDGVRVRLDDGDEVRVQVEGLGRVPEAVELDHGGSSGGR
jgi:hypothetical protein